MNLIDAKIFLCLIVALTLCQCAPNGSVKNVTDVQYYDDNIKTIRRTLRHNEIYDVYETYDDSIIDVNDNDDDDFPHRIAGGEYASFGSFPYMAVVHQLVGDGTIGQCGGTILSRRWVLTAGHCVEPYPRRFLVVFGIIDKSGIKYDHLIGPGVSMITTHAVLYPQYSLNHNDIGLLYMPQNIPFSSTIQPITLANYYGEKFANKEAHVIGWGKDQTHGDTMERLKYATLPTIRNDECQLYWHSLTDKHICTAAGLGKHACQGDSGGPLIVVENGQDIQVGIVSYGDGYCPSDLPAVFTRVSSYVNWIQKVTNVPTYYYYY